MNDEYDYYNRKSLQDSNRYCFYCLIGLLATTVGIILHELLK